MIGYIVPQGLPLLVLLPHVATLKVRDFVPNRLGEQLLRLAEMGLHVERPGNSAGPDAGGPRRRQVTVTVPDWAGSDQAQRRAGKRPRMLPGKDRRSARPPLCGAERRVGRGSLDLAVEDDVLPLDRADMTKQVGVEGKVRRGGNA